MSFVLMNYNRNNFKRMIKKIQEITEQKADLFYLDVT